MGDIWQAFDEQGNPIPDKTYTKIEAYTGLLHGAAHVWIWSRAPEGPQILVQQRSSGKTAWPNFFDISAAGHVDANEDPLNTATREAQEELGLDIKPEDLRLIQRIHQRKIFDADNIIENEWRWIYQLEVAPDTKFVRQADEVRQVFWKPLDEFLAETSKPDSPYVPHGTDYYQAVVDAIRSAANSG